jgi:hypothetical protein
MGYKVQEEKVADILTYIQKMDEINKEVGIRAFVWDVVGGY